MSPVEDTDDNFIEIGAQQKVHPGPAENDIITWGHTRMLGLIKTIKPTLKT